jgi:hypothetical protein
MIESLTRGKQALNIVFCMVDYCQPKNLKNGENSGFMFSKHNAIALQLH